MAKIQGATFCDNCGVEITWTPHYVNPPAPQAGVRRGEYCCQDCADGYRCKCGERMLLEEDRRQQDLPVEY
jgi:hypothetical protein